MKPLTLSERQKLVAEASADYARTRVEKQIILSHDYRSDGMFLCWAECQACGTRFEQLAAENRRLYCPICEATGTIHVTSDPDEVDLALRNYAEWLAANKFSRFRKNVRFFVALVGGIVFLGSLWWVVHVLSEGLF